jgi:nucleoside-triphosphatase THEP1
MANEEDSDLYRAIGMATVSSQLFEKVFVLAARFAFKQPDVRTIEEIVPVKTSTAFKQPVKALLKEISGSVPLPELEDRISALIEKRHRVVHRIVEETGWPGKTSTEEQRQDIGQLCDEVISESKLLTDVLYDLMVEWMAKIPELRGALEDQRHGPL